jgi:TfoX/Sxy family transcriptional regulator of competence genes
MAYDEAFADRIRRAIGPRPDVSERQMFGGLCFMLDGKMIVGVNGTDLMVRVGKDGYQAALARPHVRPMDFTGTPLSGFVYVGPAGTRTAPAIARWVERAIAFVATIPQAKRRAKPRPRPRVVGSARKASRAGRA